MVGWSDQGSKDLREGRGNCLNTLKEDGTELRGGDTKIILGEEAESRGGYYKKGGWNPLTNYDLGDLSAFETELQGTNRV